MKITNFGSDDIIRVTGASEGQYSYTNADLDGDGQADDLSDTFSTPNAGIVNDIQTINAVDSTGFVGDKATAISAAGFSFISFGLLRRLRLPLTYSQPQTLIAIVTITYCKTL